VSSSGLCAWPLPMGVVGPELETRPGRVVLCDGGGRYDMLSCMTLPSGNAGELGVLVAGPFDFCRLPMSSDRKDGFVYAMLSTSAGLLRFWSSILISWCTPSVASALSTGLRLSVSCDFDLRNIEGLDGRMDSGGWTIREALPNMPSRRSGRRLNSSCLKRFTART
jgi:hypothetical protein